jgi:hypothetical protein
MLLSLNIFGEETLFSLVPEELRIFFYRDLYDLSPPPNSSKGVFTDTTMANDNVLALARNSKAS